MNNKIYLAVAMLAVLAASFIVVASSDGLDAASYNASSLTAGTTYTLTAGTSVTIVEDSDGDHEYYATPTSFTVSTSTTSVKIEVFLISTEEIIETYYVYFVAPSPTYTVSFSPNPSGYGSVSTSSFTVDSGTTFSASGSTLNFSDGHSVTATPASSTSSYIYSFTNWSPSSGTVTAPMSITAYFQRTPVTPTTYSHTLYFDANGGSGAPSTMSYNTSSNVSWTFTIPNTVPTKSGYTFQGWSNNGTTYQPGGSISVDANSSKTLTAIWSSQTYSIGASVPYGIGGTVYIQDVTAGTTSSTGTSVSLSVSYGDSIRIYATAASGYTFSNWWDDDASEDLGTQNPFSFSVIGNRSLTANFDANTYTVTFNGNGGTPATQTKTVTYNQPYGNLPAVSYGTYSFDGWFTATEGGTQITSSTTVTITAAQTLYAHWSPNEASAFWSNTHYNGRVDIIFKFASTDNTTHTMTMDLYSGTVGSDSRTTWTETGYQLQIELSYPSLTVKTTLLYNDSPVGSPVTKSLGNWPTFLISIDTEAGKVTVTPVRTFDSFQSYTLYDKQVTTVFELSEPKDTAVYVIEHSDDGDGEHRARFSVVRTDVFLNTYGAVMNNPTINVYDYFPQYNQARLNFYSFALYGESMSINGTTYTLDGAYVTVEYVTDSAGQHHIPSYDPQAPVKTKTMELSNIYVTWDGTRVSLTFVNDRFTIDLGTYTAHQEIVSFQGIWYFSSMIYEPTTEMEKALGGWKVLPEIDKNTMLLIFLGFLLLIGAFAYIHIRRSNGGYVDLIIIGCAALVAFVMLGV